MEQIVHELLVDEKGNLIRGQEGGIGKVIERINELEKKMDQILEKMPTNIGVIS